MDTKALAKSKRAHSQHHSKKPHLSQKPKPTSAGANNAANAKKLTGKQIIEKTHQAQRLSALSSNWDRYEEEFDSSSEDPSGDSANKAPDIIVPKSKGADFRHLIAEAQSQLHSNPYSDSLPSLDDVLPGDFNQFLGSMLAVRGEGILSWTGNDNFVVEDRTTATPEVSFLSLNLHALAEQLEKVDLSERLFIEEDLLPPKLHSERSKANINQEHDQTQTTSERKAAAKITEELTISHFPEKVNITAKNVEHISSGPESQTIDAILSNGGLGLEDEIYSDLATSQRGESGESRAQDNSNSTSVDKKVSTFKVAAAEAELDMLLNSFSETKLLDTYGLNSKKPSSDFQIEGSQSLPQLAGKGIASSKSSAVTSSFDGLLDDLLQETSTTVNQGVSSSTSAAVNSSFDDLLDDLLQETSTTVNQGVSSSKSAAASSTFDDLLHDLLLETSMMASQNALSQPKDAKAAPENNSQSSSSSKDVSKLEVLNDFDSRLDTI